SPSSVPRRASRPRTSLRASSPARPNASATSSARPAPKGNDMARFWFALALFLSLGATLAGSAAPAAAQSYPARPIKIIVPTPAGGPADVVARLVANHLSPRLGQSLVVDNRPGAGNTIGSKEAAVAEPDGYTLLYSSASGLVLAPMLQKNAGYDPITSYDPI